MPTQLITGEQQRWLLGVCGRSTQLGTPGDIGSGAPGLPLVLEGAAAETLMEEPGERQLLPELTTGGTRDCVPRMCTLPETGTFLTTETGAGVYEMLTEEAIGACVCLGAFIGDANLLALARTGVGIAFRITSGAEIRGAAKAFLQGVDGRLGMDATTAGLPCQAQTGTCGTEDMLGQGALLSGGGVAAAVATGGTWEAHPTSRGVMPMVSMVCEVMVRSGVRIPASGLRVLPCEPSRKAGALPSGEQSPLFSCWESGPPLGECRRYTERALRDRCMGSERCNGSSHCCCCKYRACESP